LSKSFEEELCHYKHKEYCNLSFRPLQSCVAHSPSPRLRNKADKSAFLFPRFFGIAYRQIGSCTVYCNAFAHSSVSYLEKETEENNVISRRLLLHSDKFYKVASFIILHRLDFLNQEINGF